MKKIFVEFGEYPETEDRFPPLALTHMINILLEQPDVAQALVAADKPEDLEGYVTEMLRLDPPVQGIYREATANETVGSTSINAGELVYLDVSSASQNVSSVASQSTLDVSLPFRNARLWSPRRSFTLGPRKITSAAMF